ncbi:branched-chain amino acid ABC transporter permease [Streptococcus sp. A22]|uniref:branched-chain amino acid ABC transporter permease n=1 Tax=Streptococcus sp. A22 TaxID=3373126 RepID=UPI00374D07C1
MKQNIKPILTWLALVLVIFAVLSALIGSGALGLYYIQILMGIGISIIMALGTNLVLGFSGQFSLGQAGFMAIGAYATAILTKSNPTYAGFYLSILVGCLVAALVALVVGIPTLRLKGDYLAIATLGVAEIIRIAIINGGDLTNGAAGLTGILPYTTWTVVFLFVVVLTVLILNFLRSSFGRQVIAVRENEIAAESMGVNTTKVKVTVFVIAAILSSIAGSLYVGYIGTVVPKDFTIMRSIDYLIIAVLGGLGSMTGTILAALVLGFLNMFLQNFSDLRMIIYSLALILVMVFRPGGLLGTWELTFSSFFKKKAKEGKDGTSGN